MGGCPSPTIARGPEGTPGTFLALGVIESLLVGTSNDSIYQSDGGGLVRADEVQDLLIRLRVGTDVSSV